MDIKKLKQNVIIAGLAIAGSSVLGGCGQCGTTCSSGCENGCVSECQSSCTNTCTGSFN